MRKTPNTPTFICIFHLYEHPRFKIQTSSQWISRQLNAVLRIAIILRLFYYSISRYLLWAKGQRRYAAHLRRTSYLPRPASVVGQGCSSRRRPDGKINVCTRIFDCSERLLNFTVEFQHIRDQFRDEWTFREMSRMSTIAPVRHTESRFFDCAYYNHRNLIL